MTPKGDPTNRADRPKASGGVHYHTHTGPSDLAALCLIVGAPGRADMIAEKYLKGSRRFSNDGRGLVSHTGKYRDIDISVTTSGMGGPSMGIVLPEAVQSGARIFIRVGSCGSLIRESKVGDVIIPTAAIRFDRTAEDWAPPEYPAAADWRVVSALHRAAQAKAPGKFHTGVECTTGDFYTGQGRPNLFGTVPARMKARHEEALRLGAACYSMEAADLFVWCATEGGGLPAGAINAVFANRHTNEWGMAGEELAAEIALDALVSLSEEAGLAPYRSRELPKYA
ncbi:MAG: nucleoside phosphorylase [Acidobacteriia bacterium]|nr:nucleoside phosphorylase [Terriglobia bacterium]